MMCKIMKTKKLIYLIFKKSKEKKKIKKAWDIHIV